MGVLDVMIKHSVIPGIKVRRKLRRGTPVTPRLFLRPESSVLARVVELSVNQGNVWSNFEATEAKIRTDLDGINFWAPWKIFQ